jgi:hypothetical protein
MVVLEGVAVSYGRGTPVEFVCTRHSTQKKCLCALLPRLTLILDERELFIDNLLARIHSIIEMILVDRPCTMGV